MRPFRICTLYSGSGGNAVLIEMADTRILIDAGKSARTLCRALSSIGLNMEQIDAIFVTHEHTDHVCALEVLTKKHRKPVHITAESAKRFDGCTEGGLQACLCRHDVHYEVRVKNLLVRSFRTPHDSRMSVGYRIEYEENGVVRAVGVATDIGYVTQEIADALLGCEAVVLESNHDEQMLRTGPYPYELKKRILSRRGHLSNKDSACFAAHLAVHGTRAFLLAHLSEENNEPRLALDEYQSVLADPTVTVAVAAADEPTELCYGEGSNDANG